MMIDPHPIPVRSDWEKYRYTNVPSHNCAHPSKFVLMGSFKILQQTRKAHKEMMKIQASWGWETFNFPRNWLSFDLAQDAGVGTFGTKCQYPMCSRFKNGCECIITVSSLHKPALLSVGRKKAAVTKPILFFRKLDRVHERMWCQVFFPTLHLDSKDLKRSQWQAFLPCTYLPPPSIFLITGLNCMRDLDLLAQVWTIRLYWPEDQKTRWTVLPNEPPEQHRNRNFPIQICAEGVPKASCDCEFSLVHCLTFHDLLALDPFLLDGHDPTRVAHGAFHEPYGESFQASSIR